MKNADQVLEIGTGSGYAAAVLATISNEVCTIERHGQLAEQAANRSAKPPMTPDALLVRYTADVDAKRHTMYAALRDHAGDELVTSKRNALMQQLFRGGELTAGAARLAAAHRHRCDSPQRHQQPSGRLGDRRELENRAAIT